MNLEEKIKTWHADATLPPSLCARLTQNAPNAEPKSRPVPLMLRYGFAAVVGVGLGVGFVRMQRPAILSKETRPLEGVSDEAFTEVKAHLTSVSSSRQVLHEVVFFTDFECPSCQTALPQVRKLTNIELTICHFPLTQIHPDALRVAWIMEIALKQNRFYPATEALARDPTGLKTLGDEELCVRLKLDVAHLDEEKAAALKRVQQQIAMASAHGISETPTFWVHDVRTSKVQKAVGFRQLKALLAVQ